MGGFGVKRSGPGRATPGLLARGKAQAWLLAALACAGSFMAVQWVGKGQFRSEFLGGSLLLGVCGGLCLLLARWAARRGPEGRGTRLRWLGLFLLNWLFAAYLISVLAV